MLLPFAVIRCVHAFCSGFLHACTGMLAVSSWLFLQFVCTGRHLVLPVVLNRPPCNIDHHVFCNGQRSDLELATMLGPKTNLYVYTPCDVYNLHKHIGMMHVHVVLCVCVCVRSFTFNSSQYHHSSMLMKFQISKSNSSCVSCVICPHQIIPVQYMHSSMLRTGNSIKWCAGMILLLSIN